jgi:hypothetical protein
MKTIYSLALLCLMGCASKPKPFAECPSMAILQCPAGAYLDGAYRCQAYQTEHVTPEQWQAAQGLYMWYVGVDGDYRAVDWNYLVTKVFKCQNDWGRIVDCRGFMHTSQGQIIVDDGAVSSLVTLPPSGDDK